MNIIKLKVLVLIIVLTGICAACRAGNFQPRPEDEVIKLDKPGESPKGTDRDYKIGDQIAIIENDGRFSVGYSIDKICEKLIFASANLDGMERWMPFEQTSSYDGEDIEKTAFKGYRVVSGGRSNYYEWFPPEQIFPAPWANNVNLKIGDIVYQKNHGFYDVRKGVVTELPVKSNDNFRVRFGEENISTEVRSNEIFTSIYQAKPEDLSPGDIIYYNERTWAIVVDKRGGKIIIREEHSAMSDEMVDVSKLQILK